MSRIDQHDFAHPVGLAALRGHGINDQDQTQRSQHSSLMAYSPHDRRPSVGTPGYPSYTASAPRTLGSQERGCGFAGGDVGGPNRHNFNLTNSLPSSGQLSSYNHHNLHCPSPLPLSQPPANPHLHSLIYSDRDPHLYHRDHSPPNQQPLPQTITVSRSTLWWGEIEPWMDEEYAKQVCGLMGWDPVSIKVPRPAPDPATGQQANNPGYCFLTFPTPAHAASVLAQINNSGSGPTVPMPNSSKPFILNWASSVPSAPSIPAGAQAGMGTSTHPTQPYAKEYSIFVGDLAPETSNSDLVAVFRNPVLGLRNDREPKFIRPFLSCKSAKIMLDPVTGVSRGYGFVRFTDETDQQRALIEMHGLYCLSRPMRISPATAKFKPPPTLSVQDLPQVQFPPPSNGNIPEQSQSVTIALPIPGQAKSVSAPIAATTSDSSLASNILERKYRLVQYINPEEMMNLPNNVLAQIAQQYALGDTSPIKLPGGNTGPGPYSKSQTSPQVAGQGEDNAPRYTISEESWKHHAQARAILGNLIGPNGEQLTSTDPYNTTVFVGGLSPLISEETLRTFFAPFGDIHYVKVPVGKHCGFVQFVRKADAERAIEKMQGFPVGGSRIRLSWGRSQYKAAQAAAQAAQAAALQAQYTPAPVLNAMTQEQALQLLQKFTVPGYGHSDSHEQASRHGQSNEEKIRASLLAPKEDGYPFEAYSPLGLRSHLDSALEVTGQQRPSTFSPFSPDPSQDMLDVPHRGSSSVRSDALPHPSHFAPPSFSMSLQNHDLGTNGSANGAPNANRISPISNRPPSVPRYSPFLDGSNGQHRAPGRSDAPISRPPSGQLSETRIEPGAAGMRDLNGGITNLWTSVEGSNPSARQYRTGAGSSPSPQ
ncbi:hypothetical protein BD779DRAFT_1679538 [Infundibulicybe gibba]|nr:hypothetical protein BD779DRAFT_1679538 [Infundibulicybe gibba]